MYLLMDLFNLVLLFLSTIFWEEMHAFWTFDVHVV